MAEFINRPVLSTKITRYIHGTYFIPGRSSTHHFPTDMRCEQPNTNKKYAQEMTEILCLQMRAMDVVLTFKP